MVCDVEIKLSKSDRVYNPSANLAGTIILTSEANVLEHDGVKLHLTGAVNMRTSKKMVGMLEAMFSNIKPIPLINKSVELVPKGRDFLRGTSEIPFSVPLSPLSPAQGGAGELYETYHGVNINVQYGVQCEVARGYYAGGPVSSGVVEFVVEHPAAEHTGETRPLDFSLSKTSPSIVSNKLPLLPYFELEGRADCHNIRFHNPIQGHIRMNKCEGKLASIDLQLVRKEEVKSGGSTASEMTEVQSIQIADGDVCRRADLPIHFILPRLYCCPSITTEKFAVNFEVNLVIAFQSADNPKEKDALMAAHKFPVTICR